MLILVENIDKLPTDVKTNLLGKMSEAGYSVGFHFDPIIYYKDWQRFSDGGNGLYFYVDTLKFPCKNIVTKNDTIIYGLVQ